jgi:hypothetical protein
VVNPTDHCVRRMHLGLSVLDIDCGTHITRWCPAARAIAVSIDQGKTWHAHTAPTPVDSIHFALIDGRHVAARVISERARREIERQRRDERLGGLPVVERARRYLARMDASIAGAGGSLALLKACSALVGFDLGDDEALSLLGEFNQRCVPPWSSRDLRLKLRQAQREERIPRGSLLDARRAA